MIVQGTNNFVIHNAVRASAPYEIVPSNTTGPFVSSSSISSNTNPHANYIY